MCTESYMKRKALEYFEEDCPNEKGKITEVNYEEQYVIVESQKECGAGEEYEYQF